MTLADRMTQANSLLASYAVPHQGILGRTVEEPDDDTRFPFQRDRDRIIHTQAFRRLAGKTQVFIAGEGDHYRTRLTHTMEVAQISRDIARTLRLNEDLAECIALSHDLGHPPFGHAGEEALDTWMRDHSLRFEHNEQSFRIVTLLESHSSHYKGLNVNREVLFGILKHSTPHDHPLDSSKAFKSLEAELVNLADEIAYTGHDCDDGLRSGMFTVESMHDLSLITQAKEHYQKRGTSLGSAIIHLLVHDLYSTSEDNLRAIESLEHVQESPAPLIAFSDAMRTDLDALRGFLWKNMYLHSAITSKNERGQQAVLTLCKMFENNPPEKVRELQKLTGSELPHAIKDYVAGMTDGYVKNFSS